jgi:hypothetical protein
MIPRRPARDWLAEFGPIVTLDELCMRTGIPRRQGSTNLDRWQKGGHVVRLGGSTYFNVAHHPDAPRTHIGLALHRLLGRSHVIVGGSALYHGGWTTQVHHHIEVAVHADRNTMSVPKTDCGVQLVGRPTRYMRVLLEAASQVASPWEDLLMVPPEYAIIDTNLMRNSHYDRLGRVTDLPPDEVDPDYLEEDAAERFEAALARFAEAGAPQERLDAIHARYPMLQPDEPACDDDSLDL